MTWEDCVEVWSQIATFLLSQKCWTKAEIQKCSSLTIALISGPVTGIRGIIHLPPRGKCVTDKCGLASILYKQNQFIFLETTNKQTKTGKKNQAFITIWRYGQIFSMADLRRVFQVLRTVIILMYTNKNILEANTEQSTWRVSKYLGEYYQYRLGPVDISVCCGIAYSELSVPYLSTTKAVL